VFGGAGGDGLPGHNCLSRSPEFHDCADDLMRISEGPR
jgi:hypothetical protein